MMKKYTCVFILFLSLLNVLMSQNQPFIVSGYVVDSISQEPKSNINIISANNAKGLVSNENGYFEIHLSEVPDSLNFSFIGYHTKTICISNAMDTNVIVELVPKVYKLNEVAIFSDHDTYNAHIHNYSILDYGFIGDSILILQKLRSSRGQASLVLLNRNYDTIAFMNDLPKGAKMLFKDCLDSYHIITKDSAYQIELIDGSFSLYDPYDKDWFYQILGNCIFKKDENIFFELPIYDGYGHEIIYVNNYKEKKRFIKYIDLIHFMKLKGDLSDASKDYYRHTEVKASTNDSLTIMHTRHFDDAVRYVREFKNSPIRNNICLLCDTIFYLNFYESKILCFSDLKEPPTEFYLDKEHNQGWEGEILIDQSDEKLYSIEKNKAYYHIYSLDLRNGEFEYCTRVSQFQGENLSINNGYVYYLTIPGSSRNSIAKLSRIKLDN